MRSIRPLFAPLSLAVVCALLAACGGGGSSSSSKFQAMPFARDRYLITSPDTAVTGQLYASSLGNESLTFQIRGQPAHGTASIGESSGILTYTPDAGFTGNDQVTYTASSSAASSPLAAATILVNADPPTVSAFGAPVYIHGGGPASVALEVRLSNPPNGQATVDYTTADGTAQAGTDYTATSGTLTFGPGVTNQTITIPLTGAAHQVARYFYLKLSSPSSNLTMGQNLAAVVLRYYLEPLNDTGVTGCATELGSLPNPNTCPQADYPAQDAEVGRDAASFAGTLAKAGGGIFGFDFTAIGGDGKPTFEQALDGFGYTLQPWFCLRDNWTGLMWEVPTPIANAGLYDTSYTYTWYSPDNHVNGGNSGTPKGGYYYKLDTYQFVQAVNVAKLCGYSDWRLPTAAELRNLLNIGAPGTPNGPLPAIPTLGSGGYWTATPDPVYPKRATVLSAPYGYDSFLPKNQPYFVILVRGGVTP